MLGTATLRAAQAAAKSFRARLVRALCCVASGSDNPLRQHAEKPARRRRRTRSAVLARSALYLWCRRIDPGPVSQPKPFWEVWELNSPCPPVPAQRRVDAGQRAGMIGESLPMSGGYSGSGGGCAGFDRLARCTRRATSRRRPHGTAAAESRLRHDARRRSVGEVAGTSATSVSGSSSGSDSFDIAQSPSRRGYAAVPWVVSGQNTCRRDLFSACYRCSIPSELSRSGRAQVPSRAFGVRGGQMPTRGGEIAQNRPVDRPMPPACSCRRPSARRRRSAPHARAQSPAADAAIAA
jgi:hypothetical protein